MAEILLSLTIIGVVAAITLPSLTGNINERTWNTQRKALYARFSQAISLMPAINGYGKVEGTFGEDLSQDITTDTAAEAFVTEGLSKVLKINNICDYEHLGDCGIPSKVTTLDARTIDNFTTSMNTLVGFNSMFNGSIGAQIYSKQLNTRAAAFETANGESILVYYNPFCRSDINTVDFDFTQSYMCANFVYDLNGTKGPNTMGKDIGFITVIYPSDPVVVAPMPEPVSNIGLKEHIEATQYCTNTNRESRLPSRDELMAMFYNKALLTEKNSYFWSTTLGEKPDTAYHVRFSSGSRHLGGREAQFAVWCIKR